jgi:cell division protein FtsN
MANNGNNRPSTLGRNESLIIGILVGMVLGLAIAGAVAWYLVKRPSPYLSNEPTNGAKPEAELSKITPPVTQAPTTESPQAAAGADNTKPRFEFYKILTDKQDNTTRAGSGRGQATAPQAGGQPAAKGSSYFLQAASFTSVDDADKLKAKLALLGMEASVQTATIPDKGVRYRVRLGPYSSTGELNKANTVLKQNGIMDAAPVRAQ